MCFQDRLKLDFRGLLLVITVIPDDTLCVWANDLPLCVLCEDWQRNRVRLDV